MEGSDQARSRRRAVMLGVAVAIVVVGGVVTGLFFGRMGRPDVIIARGDALAIINGEAITAETYGQEVRLSEAKLVMVGREGDEVDEAALFNRMIGDLLLGQSAQTERITVSEDDVQGEIERILRRVGTERTEMEGLLAHYDLAWAYFEESVRVYLIMNAFIDRILLDGVPASERQGRLESWMRGQYRTADMHFDQGFLDQINGRPPIAQ